MRARLHYIFATVSLPLLLVLPACNGDSVSDVTPQSAERFAAQIRGVPDINGVEVFVGTDRRFLFVDGPREDAIRLSSVAVEDTVLIVTTVSQGIYYFDLAKVVSLNVSGDWVLLNF